MNLTVRLFGREVLHIDSRSETEDYRGDFTTYPVGFTIPEPTPREIPGRYYEP